MTTFLESHGYDVSSAGDGNRAVELGETGDYALAILDVHMPTYDGVEVLEMLRKRHVLHPIKVMALTADPSATTRDALEEAGIDGYLQKPVDLDELLAQVRALTGEAGA